MSAPCVRRSRHPGPLEAKGELIEIQPQRQIMLETETVQLLRRSLTCNNGDGASLKKATSSALTLELAIWRKADHS